jgi:hypothetical protein
MEKKNDKEIIGIFLDDHIDAERYGLRYVVHLISYIPKLLVTLY